MAVARWLGLLVALLACGGGPALPASTAPPTAAASPSPPAAPAAHRYTFPVQPPEVASYGRSHHDYPATDIFAPCGTRVVATTGGVVDEISSQDLWDPAVDDGATRGGLFVSVVGDDRTRYYGSHLLEVPSGIVVGQRVEVGQEIGKVGNAVGTPCHLHFGLSPPRGPGDWQVRRGVVYPGRQAATLGVAPRSQPFDGSSSGRSGGRGARRSRGPLRWSQWRRRGRVAPRSGGGDPPR